MRDKFLTSLGLCRRAGALLLGTEAVFASIRKKEAALVFTASDISEKSLKKVRTSTQFYEVEHRACGYTMAELSDALGVSCNVAVVAVKQSTLVQLF